jgi:hypothetical protein
MRKTSRSGADNAASASRTAALTSCVACVAQLNGLRAPTAISQVIECQIAGDLEDPGPHDQFARLWHTRARDPQENFLCQIVRRLPLADDPAEVAEHARSMFGEEDVGVSHALGSRGKNPSEGQSCHGAIGNC